MRNTAQYILKRLLYMIPMVLVITFLIYGGLELTPGDAISHMIPPDQLANVNPEQLEALRESYGLNDPFLLRYVRWLGNCSTVISAIPLPAACPSRTSCSSSSRPRWSCPWRPWPSPRCWAASWASSVR